MCNSLTLGEINHQRDEKAKMRKNKKKNKQVGNDDKNIDRTG